MTKTVIEAALEEEIADHVGYDKQPHTARAAQTVFDPVTSLKFWQPN